MKIAIVCYPTYGGSGVVATELGSALAGRGHIVHFISYAPPFRLSNQFNQRIFFHQVEMVNYPVLVSPQYTLSLAAKIAEVMERGELDVLHVHYAVPHATSAYLAQKIVSNKVKIVLTLHGTDITLVGAAPGFKPVVKFSIETANIVTAVSQWLRQRTIEEFEPNCPVQVIPNFVDANKFHPQPECIKAQILKVEKEKVVMHISNFRPVKRVGDVVRAFVKIQQEIPARLVLIGDGPEKTCIQRLCSNLKLEDKVMFLGQQAYVTHYLPCADLFIMTSEYESFGLAVLEAMSCGVPVLATKAGGLTETVEDGETGFLFPMGDIEQIARRALEVLTDPVRQKTMGEKARQRVLANFSAEIIVPRYEAIYKDS